MREMAKLVRAGKVRSVGVSNFSARQMAQAAAALRDEGLTLASNQVRINLLDRRVERNGVLAAARGLGVTLIAYSPLAQGVLTGRYHDDPTLPARCPGDAARASARRAAPSRPRACAFGAADRRAARVGEAHDASVAQVALAWLVTHYGETVVAIPGASRPEQATAIATAMDVRLTEAEMASIDAISAAIARLRRTAFPGNGPRRPRTRCVTKNRVGPAHGDRHALPAEVGRPSRRPRHLHA